jgi:hypothetical protein
MKPFCTSQSMTGLFCDVAFHNVAETGLSPLRTTTHSAELANVETACESPRNRGFLGGTISLSRL